jgi:hypothetical protein
MGLLRLLVCDSQRLAGLDPSRIFIMGYDELPWCGHVFLNDNQVVIERKNHESGAVCIPWQVEGSGELLLSTATLMERAQPYLLEVELARGTINRLRNQLAGWELLGLVTPDDLRRDIQAATSQLTRALSQLDDPAKAGALATSAIDLGVAAAARLASVYAEQAMQIRLGPQGYLNTLWGVDLGSKLPAERVRKEVARAFNLVALPMRWRDVEASEGQRHWQASDAQLKWAQSTGLKVLGGPLLEFDERRVPDWTYLWEGDFDTLSTFTLAHVRNTVSRYKGKVNLWHVASRINRSKVLSLGDEERLQIVASAIRTVRQLDQRTPIVVSFDQPFAEYMATEPTDRAPIDFADALVRADLGVAGLGLEINLGDQPRATNNRTPLAFSRLIDQWGLLELPLVILLTAGTSLSTQRSAQPPEAVFKERALWIDRYLPVILAKSVVQVVVWNQLLDTEAEFPQAGLFDEQDQPKPALESLAELRRRYLS